MAVSKKFIDIVQFVALIHLILLFTSLTLHFGAKFMIFVDIIVSAVLLLYLIRNWKHLTKNGVSYAILDILSAVPFVFLLQANPLAIVLNVFKVMIGMRACIHFYEIAGKRKVNQFMRLLIAFALLILFFSLTIVHIERETNQQINNVSDGFWWAVTTITSVGYGDITPSTSLGRLTAAFLMFFGVGLSSAVGAVFVHHLLEPTEKRIIREEKKLEKEEEQVLDNEKTIIKELKHIRKRLSSIEEKIKK